jgi:hypothetical protein
MLGGPLELSGAGAVAPCHHAQKGDLRSTLRPLPGEHDRAIIGVPSGQQLWMGPGSIQYGRHARHPLIGVGWGHPKELSLDCLEGMRCHRGQQEEQFVRHRGSGTVAIWPVPAARAGGPIEGAVLQRGPQGVLAKGEQCRELWRGYPRHRPYTPSSLCHLFIAGHRHLRHSLSGQLVRRHHTPQILIESNASNGKKANNDRVYLRDLSRALIRPRLFLCIREPSFALKAGSRCRFQKTRMVSAPRRLPLPPRDGE